MPEIPNIPAELRDKKGVEMVPPPAELIEHTNSIIRAAVASIAEGKNGVFQVWVDTEVGVNMAIAHKMNDNISIVGYGARKWGQPFSAGIAAEVTW